MDTLHPEQTLIENWEVKFKRFPRYGEHECRIYIVHPTIISSFGRGIDINTARVDALVRMAAGYIGLGNDGYDVEITDEALEYIAKTVRTEQRRRRRMREDK